MTKLFADNAFTTLASAVSSGNTSLSVADGSKFPSPSIIDEFDVTLTQSGTETSWEVVTVIARSGNTFTLKNPVSGTWNIGSKVELRWTAEHATNAANPAICGTAVLDFGDGSNVAFTTVMGQTDIGNNSQIDAWIQGVDSADHNAYEHMIVPMTIRAGNIVAGQGFDIIGSSHVALTGQFAVQWVRTH